MECYCDYEPPSAFSLTQPVARKPHRCTSCSRSIAPGEIYEKAWGIWDGEADTFKTCQHCIALRDWVRAHVPCACFTFQEMRDEALDLAREYAHEAPGLLFGALRRYAKTGDVIDRHRKLRGRP